MCLQMPADCQPLLSPPDTLRQCSDPFGPIQQLIPAVTMLLLSLAAQCDGTSVSGALSATLYATCALLFLTLDAHNVNLLLVYDPQTLLDLRISTKIWST